MNIYIVVYEHRYGIDTWPVLATKRPTEEQITAQSTDCDFELDRDDERLEIRGPFDPANLDTITEPKP